MTTSDTPATCTKPTVVEALALVMAEVTAVGKDGNSGQGYAFRSADAVLTAVAPALRHHGVVVAPFVESCDYAVVAVGRNRTEMSQCRVVVTYRWHGPAGDHIETRVAAEASDSSDKATSKAMTIAMRVNLLQTLALPVADLGITPPQLRHLFALFSEAGIEDRTERLQFVIEVIGRNVESSKDLLTDEAGQVIDALLRGLADDHTEAPA